MTQLPSIKLSAFNLGVGAAFKKYEDSDEIYVVTHVLYRHHNSERIGVTTRSLTAFVQGDGGETTEVPQYDAPSFHFADPVWLVGLVVNPDTWSDEDTGNWDDHS